MAKSVGNVVDPTQIINGFSVRNSNMHKIYITMFLFQPFITIELTFVCSKDPCNKAWRHTFDFWFQLFICIIVYVVIPFNRRKLESLMDLMY